MSEPKLPAHAQMSQDGVAVGKRQPQVLAAPPRLSERTSGGLQLEICRPRQMTTHRPRMEYAHAGDLASGDTAGEAAAYHFDLREFGHRSRAGVLRRSEGTRFSFSSDDEVDDLKSAIAASNKTRFASGPRPDRSRGCPSARRRQWLLRSARLPSCSGQPLVHSSDRRY